MDRLTQMRVFTTVVDRASFTSAAEALGMAKSTVSRQVSDLETRLGARLLYRTTRVIRPTDVGKAYYERCTVILGEVEEADMAVRERGGDVVRGTLHLASAGQFARQHLMGPIAAFRRMHPEVDVDLRLDDRYVNLVEDGIDMAVRITSNPRDSSLVSRKLSSTTHHIVAAKSYVDAHGKPATIDELAKHTVLSRDDTWTLIEDGGERRVSVEAALRCNQGGPLLQAVRLGHGVSLLPDFMTYQLQKRGELVRLLPQVTGPVSGIYAVYPHRRLLSGRVRAFIDHLAAEWSPAPWV